MRKLTGVAIAALLLSGPVFADKDADRKAFRAAYKAYQEAVQGSNINAAKSYAKEAFEAGEKLFGPGHKNTAALLLNYGRLIQKDEDALPILKDAISRYEKIYGEDAAELIDPLIDLAASQTGYGTLGKAKSTYRRALKLAELHYPDDTFIIASIELEMGIVALNEAQSVESMRYLRRARDKFTLLEDGASENKLAQTNFYIGKYQLADKKYKKATEALLTSLETFEKNAPNSRTTMTNHAFLIEAYERRGLSDEATKHCRAIGQKEPIRPNQDYMPVYQVHPVYPSGAQRSGKEGYAIVELTVDKDGFVKDPFVVEVDGHNSFKEASLKAAQQFRYAPRFENGEAVDTPGVRYRFSYSLR